MGSQLGDTAVQEDISLVGTDTHLVISTVKVDILLVLDRSLVDMPKEDNQVVKVDRLKEDILVTMQDKLIKDNQTLKAILK